MIRRYGPYTFDSLNDTVDLPQEGTLGTYVLQVIGTSTQTIDVQGSGDGSTYYSLASRLVKDTTGSPGTITSTGRYQLRHEGCRHLRVRNTAFTSGSWTVYVLYQPSP